MRKFSRKSLRSQDSAHDIWSNMHGAEEQKLIASRYSTTKIAPNASQDGFSVDSQVNLTDNESKTMSKFKVGDKVIFLREWSVHAAAAGQKGTVTAVDKNVVTVESKGHVFEAPDEWWELDTSTETALRYDTDKPRLELISPVATLGLARVLTKGAKKYADHNWRKGMSWSRCIGSLKRHLARLEMGEDYDFDPNCEGCKAGDCKNHTGELHIDCIQCNSMFISEYYVTHKELDDRHKISKSLVTTTAPKTNGETAEE